MSHDFDLGDCRGKPSTGFRSWPWGNTPPILRLRRPRHLAEQQRIERRTMTGDKSIPLEPRPGDLAVAGLSQARKHKRRFDAVITLEDPECRPANRLRFHRQPAPAHLVLAFEDVDDDTLGVQVATPDQVGEALAFARAQVGRTPLVHCYHGVGRSAAVALAILADRAGPGGEQAAMDQLLALRPQATPNLVVVKLADELLRRGGALVAAVSMGEDATPGLKEKRATRLQWLLSNPHLCCWL